MKRVSFMLFIALATFAVVFGQSANILTFDKYMNNVKENNINYIVEKYKVDIAQANTKAAGIFPDPELVLGGSDNQERTLQMGYSLDAGLDYTFELGNKRKARIRLAQSEAELTGALLEDYFRNLRADATLNFLSVLKQQQLLEVQRASYNYSVQLAHANNIRFKLGNIMEIDAKQSELEANTMLNDMFQSEANLKNAMLQLAFLQGNPQLIVPDSVAGVLTYMYRDFDLSSLVTTAQNNRTDLKAALKSKEVSQRNLQLAKANRAIDLGVNIGVSYNAEVRNEIAPAPSFTGIVAGVSIPLKFSNFNKGEIHAAQLAIQQDEANYQAVETQIQMEVIQAHNTYMSTCRQVEQFNTGLLSKAKSIYENKMYSYERGETSLLEVLDAQHTYNDVRVNYYETLFNCTAALIELERASGIWDIENL